MSGSCTLGAGHGQGTRTRTEQAVGRNAGRSSPPATLRARMPPRRRAPAPAAPAVASGSLSRRRAAEPASVDGDEWDPKNVVIPRPAMERPFELVTTFTPAGGQPSAI